MLDVRQCIATLRSLIEIQNQPQPATSIFRPKEYRANYLQNGTTNRIVGGRGGIGLTSLLTIVIHI